MRKIVVNASLCFVICMILVACDIPEAERDAEATATSAPTKTPTVTSTSTPRPTSTPIPTRTPTSTPVLPSILSAMAPVAEGQGIPEAGIYNPAEPGPHRVVLLTESGSPHEWNQSLPAGWLPSSVSETELVIVVGPEKEIALDSARYTVLVVNREVTVTRYRFERTIKIREARTGRTVRINTLRGAEPSGFPYQLSAGMTRIDGERVTSGMLRLWLGCDVIMSGVCERRFPDDTGWYNSVAFSPDGQTLATGSLSPSIPLWRISDGSLLLTLTGHSQEVNSVAFSPDGQLIASGSTDKTVRLWRVSDGSPLHSLSGHTHIVFDVAFSPDGQILASGSRDETVRLWYVSDGTLLRVLEGHKDMVFSVAFSPDGQTLASGSRDETVRLWRVSDGSLLLTLKVPTRRPVGSVAFSPDGQTLASGSSDGTVRLWRVSDGSVLLTLQGHAGTVNSVAFSPDGQTLVSGSDDGSVRLWQVSDGTPVLTLWQTGLVNIVTFSPDGQTLVSGSESTPYARTLLGPGDGTVLLWFIQSLVPALSTSLVPSTATPFPPTTTSTSTLLTSVSIAKAGHWEGEPSVSFDVETDGIIHNFKIAIPITLGVCNVTRDNILIGANGTFTFTFSDPLQPIQAGRNTIHGKFENDTAVSGLISSSISCGPLPVTVTDNTWSAEWKVP